MCMMKYEYQIRIGEVGGNDIATDTYHFHNDDEARQFIRLLSISLKEDGLEVTGFNKIKKENPYHIVNRLCESLQETLAYENLRRLYVSTEDDEFFGSSSPHTIVTIQDEEIEEDAWKKVDITGLEGVEIINAIMKAL